MHPVDGEGVGSTLLDDGGLWPSDEACAMESAGVLVGQGGILPACSPRCLWSGPMTIDRYVRPASVVGNGVGG